MTFSPRYRALVYASLAASFLVVVWGGVVRVTGSGLGCPDWPLCHGQFLPSLDPATRIEWTHRFLAIVSGLAVAATVLWTIARHRTNRPLLATLTLLAVVVRWPSLLGLHQRTPPWSWAAVAAAAGTFVLLLSGALVRGAG